jgi:hypothetical protein
MGSTARSPRVCARVTPQGPARCLSIHAKASLSIWQTIRDLANYQSNVETRVSLSFVEAYLYVGPRTMASNAM